MNEIGKAPLRWHTCPGKRVSVHVPDGNDVIAGRQVEALVSRLERFMDELVKVLVPAKSGGAIALYLVDAAFLTAEGGLATGAERDLVHVLDGVDKDAVFFVLYPDDADEELLSTLTQAALRRWFGEGAVSSPFFLNGLAGVVAAAAGVGTGIEELNTRVTDELKQGRTVSIFAQPASERETALQRDIAASFTAYLLTTHGAKALRQFLTIYDVERQDQAALSVYHRPLGQLEETWLNDMRKASGHKSAVLMFVELVLPLLRPYWVNDSKIMVYSLLGLTFNVVLPLSTKFLLDTIIPHKNVSLLLVFALAMFGFLLFNALIGIRRSQLTAVVVQHVVADLQQESFDHLQRLTHQFYGRAKVGDLMTRLSSDIQLVQQALSQVMGNGFMMILQTITSLIVLLYLQPLIGVLVVVIIPLVMVSYSVMGKRFQQASADSQRLAGETATSIQENISAHAVIKAFGLENSVIAAFHTRLMAQLKAAVRLEVIAALFQNSLLFASLVEQLIVLGVGGYMVIQGRITIGVLMAAWSVLPALLTPVSLLGIIIETIQTASGSLERIVELHSEPIAIADKLEAIELPVVKDALVFDHVRFGYESERIILDDLSVTIPVGANVAIVGPSGSGKSSMISLLLRFWDPVAGRILWDGHDVRDVTLSSLREQIGLVFQDTFIFDTTVRENIAIGRKDATDNEVIAAARGAKLDEYISSLPAGYNTMLGERGVRMSGGQRQRLAIARALLRDPRVLILDEATSALDAQTEHEILETLDDVKQGRTTISVTHRLTVAATADHILVLERGKLVEQGSHEELLKRGGLYARLYQEQVGVSNKGAGNEQAVPPSDVARLRAIELLKTIDEDGLARVAAQMVRRRYAAGEYIINQGEPGDAFYIVNFGQVEVLLAHHGSRRRINVLDEGEFFGEISLLDEQPRTASVRAALPTECYVLTKGAFMQLLERDPKMYERVWQTIKQRRNELALVQAHMRQDDVMGGVGLLTTPTTAVGAEQVVLAYELHAQN